MDLSVELLVMGCNALTGSARRRREIERVLAEELENLTGPEELCIEKNREELLNSSAILKVNSVSQNEPRGELDHVWQVILPDYLAGVCH